MNSRTVQEREKPNDIPELSKEGRSLMLLQIYLRKEEALCYSRTVEGRKKPNVTIELSKEGRSLMLLLNCLRKEEA